MLDAQAGRLKPGVVDLKDDSEIFDHDAKQHGVQTSADLGIFSTFFPIERKIQ
jgi:hypothetical protein